ncbi:MAG TPA: hypothetical protein VIK39_15300, partial [Candidatus Angelobacter sp.]
MTTAGAKTNISRLFTSHCGDCRGAQFVRNPARFEVVEAAKQQGIPGVKPVLPGVESAKYFRII